MYVHLCTCVCAYACVYVCDYKWVLACALFNVSEIGHVFRYKHNK